MTAPNTTAPADQYPEFRELLAKLEAEREQINAQSRPLRTERDQVTAQIAPLETRHRELTQQIRAIELPRLADLDNRIAALHRAMGARSLQEGARPNEAG
jgi:uncharacterized coiled-coil DUF342 family protein